MKVFIALMAMVAYAAASGKSYDLNKGAYAYHGKYPGSCKNDGLYYNNDRSFVFCSNGNSYVQPCAPGTRNSGADRYSYGGYYSYRDFCDVNLVDYGYAANVGGYYGGYRGAYPRDGPYFGGYRGFGPYGGYGPYW